MSQSFSSLAIRLHPDDNIAVAKQEIAAGMQVEMPNGYSLQIPECIPIGHKLALAAIRVGEPVRRYGYPIGVATPAIAAGDWVHTHNLAVREVRKEYSYEIVEPLVPCPPTRSFMGYRRSDGRVGTRNYIAVISTVNCSAHVTTEIARAFTPERLAAFPNVDSVIPIVHSGGCSYTPGGWTWQFLNRCLANVARNPNIGACVLVGLGCEENQIDGYCNCAGYEPLPGIVIQDRGGFRTTVAAGVQAVERLLPQVNACARTPQPISELTLALQCGGSDSWSGVTANPLLGRVVDRVVAQGGTGVLAETPEIFGAEHLLTQRAVSADVGKRLIERFKWWNAQASRFEFSVDNNPTPGNKRGGLTTIFEKSLGAVAKGGSTPLTAVYEYAERVTQRGLVFMDTPGNDPVSVTGQLAGGCNLIVFTTGRGSVFGSNIAPCVKVASNSALSTRMSDDMDYNAGAVLEGLPMETAADQLLELILAAASGQRTKSEEKGLPETEFVPWQLGATL
ncbi:MAG: altronate dehydratase [Chloroflexi bacterium]|nr:altronate dehydratase [Chloroflexota bacterium]